MVGSETYLRTQQVADALGVSVSTIKRWVDSGALDATRTMGKHRLVLLSSALDFARREKFPIKDLLSLGGLPASTELDERTCDSLLEALRQGRSREASAIIAAAHRAGGGAAALADRLIRPVMERIGHRWMIGSWDAYQEHQASQVIASAISDLNLRLARRGDADRPVALGAAPEGDPYLLPVLLGELTLREVGWEVRNLGADLPLRSLAAATKEYRPGLVFLSASVVVDRVRFLQDYSYFYESATLVDAAIILGGRALGPDLRSQLIYASFGDRMAHLAEFGRTMLPAGRNPANPLSNDSDAMTNPD